MLTVEPLSSVKFRHSSTWREYVLEAYSGKPFTACGDAHPKQATIVNHHHVDEDAKVSSSHGTSPKL